MDRVVVDIFEPTFCFVFPRPFKWGFTKGEGILLKNHKFPFFPSPFWGNFFRLFPIVMAQPTFVYSLCFIGLHQKRCSIHNVHPVYLWKTTTVYSHYMFCAQETGAEHCWPIVLHCEPIILLFNSSLWLLDQYIPIIFTPVFKWGC